MIRPVLLAIPIVLLFVPARADVITDADCTKPQHAQMIINHCLGLEFKAADEKLSAVYERFLAAIDSADSRKRFEAAETVWLQWRDAQCAFEAGRHGGSRASMAHSLCAIRLTEQRTKELQAYLACFKDADKCGAPQ